MSNTIGHVWAVNAEGGEEGRPSTVGPVYIENIDKLGSQIPDPEAGDAGKVLGVLNSSGDLGWVVDQSGTLTQVQSDWTEQDSTKASFILHKPNMADYATAQSLEQGLAGKQDVIDDLSDIRSGATAGSTAVQPGELATVALSGDYGDLRNRPSIPVVDQTYSPDSVNAQSGVAIASAISGKQDTIADLAAIRSGAEEGATAVQPGDLATVATSGSYNDLTDKPTIPPGVVVDQVYDPSSANAQSGTAVAGAIGNVKQVPGATSADNGKVLGVTDTSGTVGWITPAPVVTVDQTYNPNSANPQSGTAVSGAIANVNQVPASNAGDANKILKVNDQGTPEWATDVDTTYSAGTGLSLSGTTFNVVKPVPAAATADNGKMLGVTDTSGNIGWVTPPSLPATKPLVAGTNITITENANDVTISASGSSVTVDQTYDATSTNPQSGTAVAGAVSTKQDIISDLATIRSGASAGATAVQPGSLATVATSGSYNDLSNKPDLSVYATGTELSNGLATKQDTISDLSTIRSGAALGATATQPADLAPYATTADMNTALAGKQDVISDLATIRSGAAAGATAVQPGDLATVATTGDYTDLSNKPTIPSGTQLVPAATSADADKVLTVNSQGVPGWAAGGGGSTYTAGEGIDITSDVISVDHDSTLTTLSSTSQLTPTLTGSETVSTPSVGDATIMTQFKLHLSGATNNSTLSISITPETVQGGAALPLYGLQSAGGTLRLHILPIQFLQQHIMGASDLATVSVASSPAKQWFGYPYEATTPISVTGTIASLFDWTNGATIADYIDGSGDVTIGLSYRYNGSWEELNVKAMITGDTTTTGQVAFATVRATVETISNQIAVTNPLPASTSSDANKVLKVNAQGAPAWAAAQSVTVDQTYNAASTNAQSGTAVAQAIASIPSSSYTAGEGIDITSDVISVDHDSTLKASSASVTLTPTFTGATTVTTQQGTVSIQRQIRLYVGSNSGIDNNSVLSLEITPVSVQGSLSLPVYDVQPVGTGTIRLVVQRVVYPQQKLLGVSAIGTLVSASSSKAQQFFGYSYEVTSQMTVHDTFANLFNIPSGVSIAEYIDANGYITLGIAYYDDGNSRNVDASAAFTGSTGDIPQQTFVSVTAEIETTSNTLTVSNPLPASTVSDEGKILTVNSSGAPAWGMLGSVTSIQQVSALPATPDANTLYLIPEA